MAAHRLLANPNIAEAIEAARKKAADAAGVKAEAVVHELKRVAFADIREIAEFGPDGVTLKKGSELTDDAAATIGEVQQHQTKEGTTVKAKQHDKLKALELLGKMLAMFVDRQEVTEKLKLWVD